MVPLITKQTLPGKVKESSFFYSVQPTHSLKVIWMKTSQLPDPSFDLPVLIVSRPRLNFGSTDQAICLTEGFLLFFVGQFTILL